MTEPTQEFKVINELGNYCYRPLKVDSGSQTTTEDFNTINVITLRAAQAMREEALENEIEMLEENINVYVKLLSQIYDKTAKTLLGDKQMQTQPKIEVINYKESMNPGNISNSHFDDRPTTSSRARQLNSQTVSDMHTKQHDASSSVRENVSFVLNTHRQGATNTDVLLAAAQLGDEYRALNRNSSVDGRLCQSLAKSSYGVEQPSTSPNNTSPHQVVTIQKPPEHANTLTVQNTNEKIFINTPTPLPNGTNYPPPSRAGNVAENDMVSIGPNGTKVSAEFYKNLKWSKPSIATRNLLTAIFQRKVLATHSLTGQQSPAFRGCNKPAKQRLDSLIVSDIIFAVMQNCKVSEKEVRNFITTKCADENKTFKIQMLKHKAKKANKENHP